MNLFDKIMGIDSQDSIVIESSDKSTLDKNFKKKSGIEFDIVDIDDKRAKGKIDTIKGKYKNNFVGFVAFEKGTDKLAGFIRVWPKWITKDWHGNLISPIEVKPTYRGYGLGKLLMEKAIKKYNANYLFVNEDNDIAIKLYKSLGFRISDTLSHEEGDEDGDGEYYLMTLPSARKEITTESTELSFFMESKTFNPNYDKTIYNPKIGKIYFIKTDNNQYHAIVTLPEYNINARGRSEVLIIKDDTIYISKKKIGLCSNTAKIDYDVPGGSWNPEEDHALAAKREAQEEARITVSNIYKFKDTYCTINKNYHEWIVKYIAPKDRWIGYYTEIYVAEYKSQYNGYIKTADRDEIIDTGKFYKIKDVYPYLCPLHQKAIDEYMERKYETSVESAYDKPFSYDEIVRSYGKSKADELMKDDAHKFRANSGIELIHKEPTHDELLRIWENWNKMNPKDKAISDKKSMELYGLTNAENFNKLKNEYNTYSGPVLYHGSKEDLINIEARNLSFNERDFIFASNDRNYALCFAGNRWNDSMLNLSYYNGQMYLTELKYGMIKSIYDTDGFIYELPSTSFKPYKTKKNEFVSISKSITPVRRVYIKNILNELRNSGVIISYYPKKPKWWINNVNESLNNIFTESSLKSKIIDDFKPKGKKSLSDFNMVKIDKAFIDKYKSDYSSLKHVDLKDDAYAWIDKETNKLVAIASVDLSDHGDGNKWITIIEVFDNYKGYGLGKQLLDYCVKHLKGDALSVYKDNQVAIEMYKKYGFKISKESQEEIDSDKTKWYRMYLKLNATNESYYELFESIISDRKDIYHNRDKFESGEINLCFITGHSGSGKSTMGKSLSSKDNTEYFELDDVVANYNFSDDNLKEYGDLIYSFFKSSGKPYRFTSRKEFEDTDFKDRYKDYDIKITKAFIDHSIKYAKSHTSNKYVVEGVELFWCIEPKYIEDYAVYIKGTSALKSMHRAAKRDQDPGVLGYLDLFLDLNRLKTYRIYEKDLNKWYSYYSKLEKEEVVTEKSNYIIEDIYGVTNDNEWNAIVKVKGIDKPLRGRSEILIIKDDKVFLCFDRPTSIDKKYRLPGGGWNKDEDHMKSAIREAEEEAKIKTKNIMYYDTYIDVYDTPKRWVEERIPEKYWWYGYYTDVYVGEYDGKYTGYVNIQDRDSDMVKDGDFYDIKEVWDILNDFHKEAIEKYKESQIKTESSNIISYREDMLDKVKEALQSGLEMDDTQAKKLISKDSYDQFVHGECNNRFGDEDCVCIAGLNKDNFNKAYEIVKNTIKGTDFTVNKDNYFTLFLSDKNKVEKESSYEYFEERSLPNGPVTLYHGSSNGSYSMIAAISHNNGKRWEAASQSSFWFIKKEYAIAFATSELINETSEGKIVSCLDNDMKVLIPKEYKNVVDDIIRKHKTYVYIKTVDGKDVSGGQMRNFPEYTLGFDVIPDSVYTNTYIDMLNSIKYVSIDYINKAIEKFKNDKMTYGNSLFGQFIDTIQYDTLRNVVDSRRRMTPYNVITLYHGSWDASYIKLIENSPNRKQFKDLGKSVSDSHFWSISWFDKKEYAIAYATATLLNKVSKGRMISFVDKDAKVLVPEEFKDIAKIILKNNKSYVYIKNISRIDISNYKLTKYDGYKLEPEVIPDSVHVNTYKEMISLIKYVPYRYVMSKSIENFERRMSASSINESIDDSIYEVEEIMRENAFDTLYYGLDDVFTEATGKAETTIIREQIYPIVEKVLSDPNGDRKFRLLVKKFLDKNASKLNTAGPTYMIPFTDDDKEEFFKCFGTSKNDLVKPIVKMTNLVNDKAGWKSLRQNPIFCLFYCCIRYYTIKKDEKGLNTALIIYALSVYPSRYSVFFQYGANPDIMDYTIDNLSARFLFKKEGSVLATLLSSIKNSYEFHKKDFPEGTDDSVISWVSRIRNDQNSLLKNIASEYYINHRKNARIVTQSETYSDNEMIDDNLNDTSVVEDVTRRISVNIITNGVDITRATAAAKLAGISVSDLRFYLQKIISKERNEELNKFIESVVFIYLYKENHKPYEINEMKFLQFGSDLFRRTNTNDPNVVTIKELLNIWSSQSGINDKYKRIASQINYKRGIFMYIILCIQYYNQK